MAEKEGVLVLSLADGVTETVAEEVAGGVVTESVNTRLGVLKGSATKRLADTELESDVPGGSVCGGLAAGPGGSTVALFKPAVGARRIMGDVVEPVVSTVRGSGPQNAYFPYPLTRSGALAGTGMWHTPACTYDADGRLWTAAVRAQGTGWAVYITVLDGDQAVITTRAVVTLSTAANPWYSFVGLTVWNDFVQLWYSEDAGISARHMQIDADNELVLGSASLVYTPNVTGMVWTEADVVTEGNYAYLICRDASTKTTSRVSKVQLLSFSPVASLALTNTAGDSAFMTAYALAVRNGKLAVATANATSKTQYGVIDTATMTGSLAFSTAEYDLVGGLAVQPYAQGGDEWFVFAIGYSTIDALTAPTRTDFHRVTAAGADAGTSTLYWYRLQSRGAAHVVASDEVYPYFPMLPFWTVGTLTALPSTGGVPTDYVVDPSVDVFTPCAYDGGGEFTLTPVARFGVDRAGLAMRISYSQNMAVSADGRLAAVYSTADPERSVLSPEFGARWVELDLAPTQQPGVAVLPTETAMIAGSLPAVWDGIETVEAGWLHTPRLWVEETGGSLSAPTFNGTYMFTVVFARRNAGGNQTRSAIAVPYPLAITSSKPKVHVAVPTSMRDGVLQEGYTCTLYITPANTTIMRASSAKPTSVTGGHIVFDFIPTPSLLEAELYSDGSGNQELLPVCAPPARDLRSIAGRVWAIDAEDNSVWPSKTFVPGIAPEFAGQTKLVDFDAQYGRLLAVVDVNGTPHVLAERGVWSIDGYGPDNLGAGRFTVRLASNVGCRGLHTVATLPGVGVMFQGTDGRFVLLGGAGKRFDTFGVYDVCAPAVFAETNEVVYPLQTGGWVVYNWVADAWTHWSEATEES